MSVYNGITMQLHNSNGCTHVFKVPEFNKAILNIVWCKRKSEIYDGGLQTRKTFISACTQGKFTISTATHKVQQFNEVILYIV